MNDNSTTEVIEPWYKQGWPWTLIAIPFLTVVAGVITIIIASNTDDSLVQDDYYKKGLAINSNLALTQFAADNQIAATAYFDQASKLLLVKLSSGLELPTSLTLTLSHPTLDQKDRSYKLSQLVGNEYAAEIDSIEAAFWHVSINDESEKWQLKARWLYPDVKQIDITPENQKE